MTEYADEPAITRHVERHIGKVHMVFHELASDALHVDVLHVKSSLFRRREVLVTCGMSAIPMAVPPDSGQPRFAEIVTVLPRGWSLAHEQLTDEANYWPIRLMKDLARLPNAAGTWLGFGHTLGNGDGEGPPKPYAANVPFAGAILLPPMSLGKKAFRLERGGADDICFWAAVPLHPSEMDFKREHGVDPLLDLFDKHRVGHEIHPERASVVTG